MISEEKIEANIRNTIKETDFPELGKKYRGKVRDNYTDEEKQERTIIATDRISAFDVVLGTIPFKGQVLNQLAQYWFNETKNVAKSHMIDVPDPNVMRVKLCTPFPVEMMDDFSIVQSPAKRRALRVSNRPVFGAPNPRSGSSGLRPGSRPSAAL